MPRIAYPGSRGYCRPRQGDSNAHLFAQLRMLRVRQGHSLNRSTDEFDLTAPEGSHCPLLLRDFHELSRAVGPKWTGSKIRPQSCWSSQRFDPIAEVSEFPDHSSSALSS
jgi:hypothetical protein